MKIVKHKDGFHYLDVDVEEEMKVKDFNKKMQKVLEIHECGKNHHEIIKNWDSENLFGFILDYFQQAGETEFDSIWYYVRLPHNELVEIANKVEVNHNDTRIN